MRAFFLFFGLAILPCLAIADPNDDPSCGGPFPALGIVQVGADLGFPYTVFYLDDRGLGYGNGAYLYQESNGVFDAAGQPIANLQRGGVYEYLQLSSEICTDSNSAGPDYYVLGYN